MGIMISVLTKKKKSLKSRFVPCLLQAFCIKLIWKLISQVLAVLVFVFFIFTYTFSAINASQYYSSIMRCLVML